MSNLRAFLLQASIIVFFLAGSAAPTPLYAVYQAEWGFSPITVTLIFGIYAIAVLAALLVAGSLSDYVGRRPVLVVSALLQAITMVLFATADGLGVLITARVVQGLATGAASAAVGAGLLDLDRQRGAIANALSPMIGTATGALMSGLMVELLPAPTVLVYLVLGVVFVAQAIALLFIPETATPHAGAWRSLRPRFALPPSVRPAMLAAAPVLIGAWALPGFYASLGPVLVRKLTGSTSIALGGLTLALMAASGVVTTFVTRAREANAVMLGGIAALIVGTGLSLVGITTGALVPFFAGCIISGAGFGAGFQGAIRTVVSRTAAHERAGVVSILYVIAYLAMGLPAVLAGLRVAATGDLRATAIEYGVVVIALALVALVMRGLHGRAFGRPAVSR